MVQGDQQVAIGTNAATGEALRRRTDNAPGGRCRDVPRRYVLFHPGTTSTGFVGEFDPVIV
ncbi:hypothetical protein [Saccharothrix saharensis]|uniref:hypothetical protein n=1 Tax=Saccharothrix saharensis TaxID=571190 RepID=UPI001150E664|nr:hypothetical protein [Saccharothrix saharensis]